MNQGSPFCLDLLMTAVLNFFKSFPIYLFFEFVAFATAVFRYNQVKNTVYRYFIVYLFLIVIYEIASLNNILSIRHTNLWAHNISFTLSFLFLAFTLRKLLKSPKFKTWITWAIYFSILCSAINMAFIQGFWKLDSITLLLQNAIIVVINFLYFYELMNYSGEHLNIIKLPGFWLNTGLLFFSLFEFLFFSSFAYMAYNNDYNYLMLFIFISYSANVILYSCITLALLCPQKTSL